MVNFYDFSVPVLEISSDTHRYSRIYHPHEFNGARHRIWDQLRTDLRNLYFNGFDSHGLFFSINCRSGFVQEIILKAHLREVRLHSRVKAERPKIQIPKREIYEYPENLYDPWLFPFYLESYYDMSYEARILEIEDLFPEKEYPEVYDDTWYRIEYIREHLQKFKFEIQTAYQRRQKRIEAAKIIQRQFLKCYYHPEYKLCRDRLEREYNSFFPKI